MDRHCRSCWPCSPCPRSILCTAGESSDVRQSWSTAKTLHCLPPFRLLAAPRFPASQARLGPGGHVPVRRRSAPPLPRNKQTLILFNVAFSSSLSSAVRRPRFGVSSWLHDRPQGQRLGGSSQRIIVPSRIPHPEVEAECTQCVYSIYRVATFTLGSLVSRGPLQCIQSPFPLSNPHSTPG